MLISQNKHHFLHFKVSKTLQQDFILRKKQTINAKCGPEMSRTSFNGCRYMCSTYCNKAVTNCHLGWKPWAAKFIMSLKKKQHRQASPFLWLNVSQIWPNFGLLPPVVKFFFLASFSHACVVFYSCITCGQNLGTKRRTWVTTIPWFL